MSKRVCIYVDTVVRLSEKKLFFAKYETARNMTQRSIFLSIQTQGILYRIHTWICSSRKARRGVGDTWHGTRPQTCSRQTELVNLPLL